MNAFLPDIPPRDSTKTRISQSPASPASNNRGVSQTKATTAGSFAAQSAISRSLAAFTVGWSDKTLLKRLQRATLPSGRQKDDVAVINARSTVPSGPATSGPHHFLSVSITSGSR